MKLSKQPLTLVFATCALFFSAPSQAQNYVCATSNVGEFCMQMLPDAAPRTVINFLRYVNTGGYHNTIIHRATTPSYAIQGGGFYKTPFAKLVPAYAPVVNEYSLPNARGTVAMARKQDPNSATSHWFINITDNSESLNSSNGGGYAVFAEVVSGMDVVDMIASMPRSNLSTYGSAFGEVPVLKRDGGVVDIEDLIVLYRVYGTDSLPDLLNVFNSESFSILSNVDGELYRARLNLVTTKPNYTFIVDKTSLSPEPDLGQRRADFSTSTGILEIPYMWVGETLLTNLKLRLTSGKNLTFMLESFSK